MSVLAWIPIPMSPTQMTDTPRMVIRILTLDLTQTRNLALAHLALALT